jgi:NAD(P)H-nitrite reductase large subunit
MESSHHKTNEINQKECSFLVVGGGIAGVSCAETINFLAPGEKIIILTESSLIKSVTNLVQLGKYAQRFDIKEIAIDEFSKPNVEVITDELKSIKSKEKMAQTAKGLSIKFKLACMCTGARPKIIHKSSVEDFVIGIRDTDSVKEFQKKIKTGRRFVLIGNGGIASEIAYEIKNIQIDWVIKDKHLSSTFIDAGASKFFESRLRNKEEATAASSQSVVKRMRYMEERDASEGIRKGAALGPDWHRLIDMTGSSSTSPENIKIHYGVEVKSITRAESDFPICVELTNGEKLMSDFVVSATGVEPHKSFVLEDAEFKMNEDDGGIVVDELMRTSISSIYAAGDVCSAGWEQSNYWHQMRLWTQARQMGMMAGKSMVADFNGEEIYQDFCFELFSHVTKLYGFQVVLLGKYNGQGLNDEYELLFRVTPDKEYIKFVLKNGRLVGALLIGETGLEETCENLILNQIDLTPFGDDILNPDIDIEDYFD